MTIGKGNDYNNKKIITIYQIMMFIFGFGISVGRFLGPQELLFYGDQLGPLSVASFFAGKNWGEALGLGNSYYGFGYYWIYFILIKYIQDYHVLYFSIIFIDAFLCALTGVIINWFVSAKIMLKWGWKSLLLSLVCYSLHTYWVSIMNEKPAFMLVWIITLVICKLFENKYKVLYSMILAVLLGYSVSVHERMIVLSISIVMVIVFWRVLLKKSIVNIPSFMITLVFLMLLVRYVRNVVIEALYSCNGELANVSVLDSNVTQYFSFDTITYFIVLVLTNLYKFVIGTYGVGIIALVVSVLIPFIFLRKKEDLGHFISKDNPLLFIFYVFLLAVIATIGGLAFNQSGYISYGIANNITNLQAYKSFFYFRYYGVYTGPIVAIAMRKEIVDYVRQYKYIFVIALIVVFKITENVVFPYIQQTTYIGVSNDFAPVYYNIGNSSYNNQIINATISLFILVIFLFLLLTTKEWMQIIALILSIGLIIVNNPIVSFPKVYSTSFDNVCSYLKSTSRSLDGVHIYSGYGNVRVLQFMLQNSVVGIYTDNVELKDDFIVITRQEIDGLEEYKESVLEDTIYIYSSKGE